MKDEYHESSSTRAIALVLSGRIRMVFVALLLLALTSFVILVAHRPVVSNEDIYGATFSPRLATELVARHATAIREIFDTNFESLDDPWAQSAWSFKNATSEDEARQSLDSYLTETKAGRARYLQLLLDHQPIRETVADYVELQRASGQVFNVPFTQIALSRNEAALYLSIVCFGVHIGFVMKRRYLLTLRDSDEALRYLPDPSLLTATPRDLQIFGKCLRVTLYLGQHFAVWFPVLAIAGCVVSFFGTDGNWNLTTHTRTFVAIVVLGLDVGVTALLQFCFCRSAKRVNDELFQ